MVESTQQAAESTAKIVNLSGVTKRFHLGDETVTALQDLTLEIARGSFLAVMGPSGAGKSTLLHVIAGLEKPSEGAVIVDGIDVTSMSLRRASRFRRDITSFVFQFFSLLDFLSIEDNVAVPGNIRGDSRSARRERANELLQLVGLEHRRHHFPSQISGGEQQRAALARALYLAPPLLLADEPTGNLDSETGQSLVDLISTTQRALGHTVLIATHDPVVAAFSDQAVFLQDGNLVSALQLTDVGNRSGQRGKRRAAVISTWLQELRSP